jgi:hypothetical protein
VLVSSCTSFYKGFQKYGRQTRQTPTKKVKEFSCTGSSIVF